MPNLTRKDRASVAAASEAYEAFVREVASHRRIWTLRDAGGFPTVTGADATAMPFWSALSRVEQIIGTAPTYAGFTPVGLPWEKFRDQWLPGLERDHLQVGINWSGPRALGYDVPPKELRSKIEEALA